MGWFDKFTIETRNDDPFDGRQVLPKTNTGEDITSIFGDTDSVTEEEVLRISTVQACINIITGTIATLPIKLYKLEKDGDVKEIVDDKRTFLINDEPNEMFNGYNFKKRVVQDYLLWGTGYIKVDKVGNKIVELHYLDARNTSVLKYIIDGYKQYAKILYSSEEGQTEFLPYEVALILKDTTDGLTSKGLLHTARDVFSMAVSEMNYTNRIFENGALPTGVLKTVNRLSETAIRKLRDSWSRLYTGSKNAGKTIILEEGLEYVPIMLNPKDLGLAESKLNSASEVCRVFGVPESLVMSSANKYGSISMNNLHFLQYTLSPILHSIESAFNKTLLLETEKEEGYYFEFDTTEVLRTTEKEKYESLKTGLDAGILSINECRHMVNKEQISKNFFKWSLGNILYDDETGELLVPNMGLGTDLDGNMANNKSENIFGGKHGTNNKSDNDTKPDNINEQE